MKCFHRWSFIDEIFLEFLSYIYLLMNFFLRLLWIGRWMDKFGTSRLRCLNEEICQLLMKIKIELSWETESRPSEDKLIKSIQTFSKVSIDS